MNACTCGAASDTFAHISINCSTVFLCFATKPAGRNSPATTVQCTVRGQAMPCSGLNRVEVRQGGWTIHGLRLSQLHTFDLAVTERLERIVRLHVSVKSDTQLRDGRRYDYDYQGICGCHSLWRIHASIICPNPGAELRLVRVHPLFKRVHEASRETARQAQQTSGRIVLWQQHTQRQ